MEKFIKQLLTGLIALGLLAPVATSSLNPIKTTINAKSRWHRGIPAVLKGSWQSRRYYIKYRHHYERNYFKFVKNNAYYAYAGCSDPGDANHLHYRRIGRSYILKGNFMNQGIKDGNSTFILKKVGKHYRMRNYNTRDQSLMNSMKRINIYRTKHNEVSANGTW